MDAVVECDVTGDQAVDEEEEEHKDAEGNSSFVEATFLLSAVQNGLAGRVFPIAFAFVRLELVETVLLILVVVDCECDEGDEPEELRQGAN